MSLGKFRSSAENDGKRWKWERASCTASKLIHLTLNWHSSMELNS